MRYLLPAVCLILAGLSGCGYKSTAYVNESNTIAVPVFDNQTTYRENEFELTRAVHNQIKTRTPLQLVAKPESADLLLKGEIIDYKKPVAIEGKLDVVLASEVVMTVKVTLIDQKTGKTLVDKQYSARGDVIPSRQGDEATARARIYEEISQWVVTLLEQ